MDHACVSNLWNNLHVIVQTHKMNSGNILRKYGLQEEKTCINIRRSYRTCPWCSKRH